MVYFDSSKTIIVDITGIFYPFLEMNLIIINANELQRQIGELNLLTTSP